MLNYKKNIEINYQNLDYTGKVKLPHLLDEFSNIATTHALKIGVWSEDLFNQYGWILSKMHLEMSEPIHSGDYQILTYPGYASKVIFPRYYQLLDNNQQPVLKASSIWTLLDLNRRRITTPKKAGIRFPDIIEVYEEIVLPKETNKDIDYILKQVRTVEYGDVDTNQHMNNAKYIEWACNLIDYDLFKDHYIAMIDIFFKHEIAPKQDVSLYYANENDHHYIKGCISDIVCFEIEILLNK